MPKKKKFKLNLDLEDENKKPTVAERIQKFLKTDRRKHTPITFNVGVAIILFFCYCAISIISVPSAPMLLLVLLPTLYILIRYIKLERDHHGDYYA
jgi:hypothetical protein